MNGHVLHISDQEQLIVVADSLVFIKYPDLYHSLDYLVTRTVNLHQAQSLMIRT